VRLKNVNARGTAAIMARYLYPSDGAAGVMFYVDHDTVYEPLSGKPVFYIRGNVVYAYDGGKAIYWISDKHLFEYGSGQDRFYFSD